MLCPVCGNSLTKTDVGEIYFCLRKNVTYQNSVVPHAVMDATIHLDDEGKVIYQVIEIPPFLFKISDDDNGQRTEVEKITYHDTDDPHLIEYRKIFDIQIAMSLPWHDRGKVISKLKTYILFS